MVPGSDIDKTYALVPENPYVATKLLMKEQQWCQSKCAMAVEQAEDCGNS
jgi:hypothetical protein